MNDLYEIFDYIKVQEDAQICPVFLEAKKNFDDKDLDRYPEAGIKEVKMFNQYLLQLWSTTG